MMIKLALTYFLLFATMQLLVSQNIITDPDTILNKLSNKIDQVHDYKADIEIEVKVDFINIPVKHATMIFKQPDKIKFKSEGFFMVPKRGIRIPVKEILDQPHSAIYQGTENIGEDRQYVIKVVPLTKNPDIILTTWWINTETYLLTRAESTTRDQGTFNVDFKYYDADIPLPSEMIISFEIDKINLPLKFLGKTQGMEIDKTKLKEGESHKGKVMIRFTNYEINFNPPDEIFKEDEFDD